jgi:dTDP-4-amino-4,6-dideoxygalactose transaminase
MEIGFNKPCIIGREMEYIADTVKREKLSGDGYYTRLCHQFFEERYGFNKVLLTTSCTDALEMAAILIDVKPGDEVIIPSFTFVSSANPFVLRGAKIVFTDVQAGYPNVDASLIEPLITTKTKAIVVVHYAGVACQMDQIMAIAAKHNLIVIEDAAHAIDSFYKGRPLGGIGHLGCFSFHETKNIISGEGGMLVINDNRFAARAEIIWEKGTNRSAFFRGEVDKYSWVDIGSSYLPSEITAAFLFAQLEKSDQIQTKRKQIWEYYYLKLSALKANSFRLPEIPDYATNNGHLFYLVCQNQEQRDNLIQYLKEHQIQAIFHYLPLHNSVFYQDKHDGRDLPNTLRFSDCLVRLPFYYDLSPEEQDYVVAAIEKFASQQLT